MINTETAQAIHTTVADQSARYPISFKYDVLPDTLVPELLVTLDGAPLTYGTDYTVDAAGLQLVNAPEANKTLVIKRDVAFTQEIDYQTGLIDPDQIEDGFDRSVMRDQELKQNVLDVAAALAAETEERTTADTLLQDAIDDEADAREDADDALQAAIDTKQDIIADLATIRSGAAAGATAVQPSDLATVATTGSYNDLSNKPKYATSIQLTIDSSTYVVTAQLKDQDNNNIGAAQTIDLPLESVVVSGAYDSATKEVVLTLEGGSTVRFSVADLVSGLQSEITSVNMLGADLVDDTNSAHKFVTAAEKTAINTAVQPADLPGVMTGADGTNAGTSGLAPAPAADDNEKFLSGDGTWKDAVISVNGSTGYVSIHPVDIGAIPQYDSLPSAGPYFLDTTVLSQADGYFYKCVSDGQIPATYSWTRVDVQPTGVTSVNGQAGDITITASGLGALVNNGLNGDLAILGSSSNGGQSVALGRNSQATSGWTTSVGTSAKATSNFSTAIGNSASASATNSIAIGYTQNASAAYAIQIGGLGAVHNNDPSTLKVSNANGNFELMSADGTIPEARLADTTNAQQGDVLTLNSTGNAVWQAGGGGATYTAGNGISIDANNEISVTDPVLVNNSQYGLAIGGNASCQTGVALGSGSSAEAGVGNVCVAVGVDARAYGWFSVQLGQGDNRDANTLKVGQYVNGDLQNYELLSEGGTVPTARLTKVNTTITLTAAGWSNSSQTVNVTGMTADGVVFVNPTPANQSAYTSAGILCTAQATGSLTFTCDTVPSADITVTVVML